MVFINSIEYVQIYMCEYLINIYMYVDICICICIHIYEYIQICINIYIHKYIFIYIYIIQILIIINIMKYNLLLQIILTIFFTFFYLKCAESKHSFTSREQRQYLQLLNFTLIKCIAKQMSLYNI